MHTLPAACGRSDTAEPRLRALFLLNCSSPILWRVLKALFDVRPPDPDPRPRAGLGGAPRPLAPEVQQTNCAAPPKLRAPQNASRPRPPRNRAAAKSTVQSPAVTSAVDARPRAAVHSFVRARLARHRFELREDCLGFIHTNLKWVGPNLQQTRVFLLEVAQTSPHIWFLQTCSKDLQARRTRDSPEA